MNNTTFLHPIYVNTTRRAVYDGSLQGFTKALEDLGIDLKMPEMMATMYSTDIPEDVLEYIMTDMGETLGKTWCITEDENPFVEVNAIYITIPGFPIMKGAPQSRKDAAFMKRWTPPGNPYARYAGMDV